jgi:hypothetical protein
MGLIDIEIDQPIKQQERPFLAMALVEARPGAASWACRDHLPSGAKPIQRTNFEGVR